MRREDGNGRDSRGARDQGRPLLGEIDTPGTTLSAHVIRFLPARGNTRESTLLQQGKRRPAANRFLRRRQSVCRASPAEFIRHVHGGYKARWQKEERRRKVGERCVRSVRRRVEQVTPQTGTFSKAMRFASRLRWMAARENARETPSCRLSVRFDGARPPQTPGRRRREREPRSSLPTDHSVCVRTAFLIVGQRFEYRVFSRIFIYPAQSTQIIYFEPSVVVLYDDNDGDDRSNFEYANGIVEFLKRLLRRRDVVFAARAFSNA